MMVPKRETPEAIEERSSGYRNYPRWGNSVRKRKVIGVFIVVLCAVVLITGQFYVDKMIWGPRLWEVFWVFPILIGVWLIVGAVRVFRKGP
jgi:hypothetical protein